MSLRIYREIVLREPGVPQQYDLWGAQSAVGRIYELQEALEKALDEYTEAAAIAQRPVQADPPNAQWRPMLAVSLIDIAMIHKSKQSLASARDGFSRAATLLRELLEFDPAHRDFNNDYRFALHQLDRLGHPEKSE